MTAIAILLGYGATREVIEPLLDGTNMRAPSAISSLRNLLTVTASESGREYTLNFRRTRVLLRLFEKAPAADMHRRAGAYYETEAPDLLRAALHFQRAGECERAAHLATSDVWTSINRGEARLLREVLDGFTR